MLVSIESSMNIYCDHSRVQPSYQCTYHMRWVCQCYRLYVSFFFQNGLIRKVVIWSTFRNRWVCQWFQWFCCLGLSIYFHIFPGRVLIFGKSLWPRWPWLMSATEVTCCICHSIYYCHTIIVVVFQFFLISCSSLKLEEKIIISVIRQPRCRTRSGARQVSKNSLICWAKYSVAILFYLFKHIWIFHSLSF